MKNKGYFGGQKNTEKSAISKTSLIVIIVIAFFIPAIAATLLLMGGSGDTDTVTEKYTQVSIYYEDELLFEEKSTPQDTEKSVLVDIFSPMSETLTQINAPLREIENEKTLRIIIATESSSNEYNCYFSEKDGESFCIGGNTVYRINNDVAFSFMSSAYSEVLHSSAIPPKLSTTSNDTVIPYSANWRYKALDGKMIDAVKVKTTSEELLYDMAGALGLNFEVEPDSCTVEIYNNGIITEKLDSSDLSSITVEPGTTLQFKVTATWEESETSSFAGTVTYSFKALLRDRSEFTVNKTSLAVGDFIMVSATNIIDTSKIQFSSTPDIGFSPVFLNDGDLVKALIPFDYDLDEGLYKLTFTHGAATETIDIELSASSASFIEAIYAEDLSTFNTITSQSSLNELNNIINALGREGSEYIFFRTPFIDYANTPSLSLRYNYGTVFETADGKVTHTLQGVEYTSKGTLAASVTALNSGIVLSTGSSAYLGNFVIIEHGMGLRTVYGHLGSITVHKGDNVSKSQVIGTCGKLTNASANGVLVMCYVFDVAVDYRKIAGQDIFN